MRCPSVCRITSELSRDCRNYTRTGSISEAIEKGRYHVKPEKIAEKMIGSIIDSFAWPSGQLLPIVETDEEIVLFDDLKPSDIIKKIFL